MLTSEMIAKHPYENKHNIKLISLMKGYLCSFSFWSHLCFMDFFYDSILTLTSLFVSNYETFSFCFPQKFLSEMNWFFVGPKQLDTQLGYLDGNLSTINSSMNNLKSSSANMTAVTTAGSNAMTNTAKIPNNVDSGGNMTTVTYSTPLNSNSTTSTINSTFPSALGSSTTGGYVGTLYTTMSNIMTSINTISTAADNFVT